MLTTCTCTLYFSLPDYVDPINVYVHVDLENCHTFTCIDLYTVVLRYIDLYRLSRSTGR